MTGAGNGFIRMHSRRMISALLLLLLAVFLTVFGGIYGMPEIKMQLAGLKLEDIHKVMVVAHPDDETFWGGAHLADEPYLVVCLTGGDNRVRRKEFQRAVRLSGGVPLILSFPDKVSGVRSQWTDCRDKIEEDLCYLFQYKDWDAVVTHNPDGEYGHIHHKMTNSLVTEALQAGSNKPPSCFGTYYSVKKLRNLKKQKSAEELHALSGDSYQLKKKMIDVYRSQKKVVEKFHHMFPYENWYEP